jgi:hypothetical protein
MKMLSRRNFEELSKVNEEYLLSIYTPTNRTGENEDSMLHFKNELKNVEKELEELGVRGENKNAYLKKCNELLEDTRFWRNQEDCLAVFASKNRLDYFTLPYRMDNFSMTGTRFYLLPLIPAFNRNGFYFLLTLSLGDVRLYSASGSRISEIPLDEQVPQSLEEAAGYDYEQKSLQFRTGLNQGRQGMFHGQGSGKDDKDIDREKFFRELGNHLDDLLKDYDLPLLVYSTEENFHQFRENIKYPNVYPEFVSGNPDEVNESELHQKSWDLIRDYFTREKEEKRSRYEMMHSRDKATSDTERAITGSINGAVDTLFIEKDKRLWGHYVKDRNSIEVHADKQQRDECLLNRAGVSTFLQQGNVYLVEEEELPGEKDGSMRAIMRF